MKKKNNLVIWVVVSLIALLSVCAESEIRKFSTTITIRINNETVEIENELGAIKPYAIPHGNSTTTAEWTFNIYRNVSWSCNTSPVILQMNKLTETHSNLSRTFQNMTDFCRSIMNEMLENMSTNIKMIREQYTDVQQYYNLYAKCYANLTQIKSERDALADYKQKYDNCTAELVTQREKYLHLQNNYNNLNEENADCLNQLSELKNKSKNTTSYCVLAFFLGVGVVIGYNEFKKRKKIKPAPISNIPQRRV